MFPHLDVINLIEKTNNNIIQNNTFRIIAPLLPEAKTTYDKKIALENPNKNQQNLFIALFSEYNAIYIEDATARLKKAPAAFAKGKEPKKLVVEW